MLSVEQFKERIARTNHSDSFYIVVDANNENQFFFVGNGGMGSSISAPIERFSPEIKEYIISMINSDQLIRNEKQIFLSDRNIWVYSLSYTSSSKGNA